MTGNRLFGMGGRALVTITGACPEDCLYAITLKGVRFSGYRKLDELTAQLMVPAASLHDLEACAKKTMCALTVIRIYGLVPSIRRMGWRIGYLLFLICLVFTALWMQNHIWFLSVEGNTTIPASQILQILDEKGIGFWTSTENLDINLLKNEILSEIPELTFITINTEGGIATVVVRQREEKPVVSQEFLPSNILAKKSGIITEVTATGGTPMVTPGDVVTVGQMLISGVTNLDKTLLVTRAEGEVYARTFTRKNAVLPEYTCQKAYTGEETRKISITFGKNTINFYKSSGISYDNYDKMTDRNTLTLPGGYALPVTITVSTFREYQLLEAPLSEDTAQTLLLETVETQTKQEMVAGELLHMNMTLECSDGCFHLRGIVECREEIGSVAQIKD